MAEVVVEHKGGLLMEARWGASSVAVDAGGGAGQGEGRAMAPLPLFAASLGSCVAAFVAGYCANAGIDTTGMTVTVRFRKVGEPHEKVRLGSLSARIRMPPQADLGRRRRAVLEAAESCILHQTLLHFDGLDVSLDEG